MLLAEQVRDPAAEQRLLRRQQLTEGLHWLYAAQGDPYAALLCGTPGGQQLRERGPMWRSATGAWVVTDHAIAARALVSREAVPETPFGLSGDPGSPIDCTAAVPTDLPERFDLAAVARRGAAHALSGGDPATAELLADAEPALDAVLRPQDPARTSRMLAAVTGLRERTDRPLLAVTGVRLAATLAVNAVAALLSIGGWPRLVAAPAADGVVTETLRHAPPVRLLPLTLTGTPNWGGGQVAGGQRVVLMIAVANRDPAVFRDPDRFDPDRFEEGRAGPAGPDGAVLVPGGALTGPLQFARRYATALLDRLGREAPRLRPDGHPVRPARTPVTGTAVRYPVRTD